MNVSKINIRRVFPAILLPALLICAGDCGNVLASNPALPASTGSLPLGFRNFSESRVFGRYDGRINGYDVKVMMLPEYRTWRGSCRAVIDFSNGEENYKIVHDGWSDNTCYDEDAEKMLVADNTVLDLSYDMPRVPARQPFTLDIFANMPFFFYDIDFDGKDELLLNLHSQGQRWKNAYEVVQMEPDRLYSIYRKAPFTDLDDMTIIDPANKTITINLYMGSGEELRTVYKIEEDDLGVRSAKKLYTDDMCFGGVGDDTKPVYRRIRTREQQDTTRWMPIKDL